MRRACGFCVFELPAGGMGLGEEIDAELTAHIELAVEELMRGGMSEAEAQRAARVRFGNPTAVKERVAGAESDAG